MSLESQSLKLRVTPGTSPDTWSVTEPDHVCDLGSYAGCVDEMELPSEMRPWEPLWGLSWDLTNTPPYSHSTVDSPELPSSSLALAVATSFSTVADVCGGWSHIIPGTLTSVSMTMPHAQESLFNHAIGCFNRITKHKDKIIRNAHFSLKRQLAGPIGCEHF